MQEQYYALGMIETIGYPGLIAAVDGALKTADVRLKTVQKADAGIVTVYIVGDVASVKVAVEVGAELAARVGMLNGKHVIPNPDQNTVRMIIGDEKKTKKIVPQQTDEKADEKEEVVNYRMMTLVELKELASGMKNIQLTDKEITKIRKDDLVQLIEEAKSKEGGDN